MPYQNLTQCSYPMPAKMNGCRSLVMCQNALHHYPHNNKKIPYSVKSARPYGVSSCLPRCVCIMQHMHSEMITYHNTQPLRSPHLPTLGLHAACHRNYIMIFIGRSKLMINCGITILLCMHGSFHSSWLLGDGHQQEL